MDKLDKKLQDRDNSKIIRTMFVKAGLDISMADIRVSFGICFITGKIKRYPKAEIDSVESTALKMREIIMKRFPSIKDALYQCTFQEEYFK